MSSQPQPQQQHNPNANTNNSSNSNNDGSPPQNYTGATTLAHTSPWPVYSFHWAVSPNAPAFRIALGSFMEQLNNKIQILQLDQNTKNTLVVQGEADHPYPPTKLQWIPDKAGIHPEVLASSSDYLRIWKFNDNRQLAPTVLSHSPNSEFTAPLTSFDWNETDITMIGTASIDTTCTIWNIETGQAKTQLIAHDKEVFDIAFAKGDNLFASVGADGSLRMFDLRSLEHSTILYDSPDGTPLLRLAWNKQDPNYIATFQMDSSRVLLLDIRVPSVPVTDMRGHTASVNSICWAPYASNLLCSAGDDGQTFIWDTSQLQNQRKIFQEPILSFKADHEINQVVWSISQPDWIAISNDTKIQALLCPRP